MTTRHKAIALRFAGAALMGANLVAVATLAVPAAAQDSTAEARLRKIEAEVRALQRKVFPGGDSRFFEPEIAPSTQAAATEVPGSGGAAPAATPVTDILVRLDALEGQLRALTARSEEQANTLAQVELRLAALETAATPPAAPAGEPAGEAAPPMLQPAATLTASTAATVTSPTSQTTQRAPAQPAQASAPPPAQATTGVTAPSAARLAAVQAIAKPQTSDAGDDEYSYGFRLWNAGFYPEARQQLAKFVEAYPNHARISFGRNLLGRAFLDDNMPEDAARWFLKNYQANKAGERAPDSLLYLGASMIAMNDTKRACIALAEFAETYPLVAAGRLATEYQTTRAKVKCG